MDQRLQVFVSAATHLNFSRAAEELYISQPAVSQQISALEQELGVPLFDRQGRTVRLTKAGAVALHHSQQILRTYADMTRLIADLTEEPRGSLAIGASYTYGEYVLPHVLAPFLAEYPAITPVISIANSRDIEERIAQGELDLGIIEKASVHRGVSAEPLATDHLRIVAALRNAPDLTVEKLAEQVWIVREEGSGTREMTDRLFSKYGLSPRAMMPFSSTQVIKEAVEAGLGIALLSEWAIVKERQLQTLAVLPWPPVPMTRDFSLILPKSDFATKAAQLFGAHLRAHAVPD